jgi:hypothetical protein
MLFVSDMTDQFQKIAEMTLNADVTLKCVKL